MCNALRVPPGPKGHWLSGNLPEFRRDALGFLTHCARTYGDVVALRLAHRRVLVLSHPDLIKEVLVAQSRQFSKDFGLRRNPRLLGQGLLTSEGDFWRRQRRLIQPAFARGRIAGYADVMVAAARQVTDSWKAGERRDIAVEMMRLTLQIAAKTLFDAEVGDETRTVVDALGVLQNTFQARCNTLVPVPLWLPTPGNIRRRRAIRRLDEILYGFIRRRRAQPSDRGDLLSLLLAARDEQGAAMTDHQVRDEAMTLFLAGHETTALALSWAWYLLAQHPEAEASLAAEVRQVLGDRDPTFEDCARLKYTEMVALEAMRLFPPAYILPREALADCVIGGYVVPRGTMVLMSQWVVQRDPRFFRDPERFRPERWHEEAIRGLPKFAYFPFGGGQRMCIGSTFAMMELVLVLATIAQRFCFRVPPDVRVTPVATFTLRPSPGIPGEIVVRRVVRDAARPRDSLRSSRAFIESRVRSGSKKQLVSVRRFLTETGVMP